MKGLFTFFIFLLASLPIFAQVQVEFDIKTADFVTGKKLSGVTVEVYDGGTQIKSMVTPSNGNVKFSLPAGKVYKVLFIKAGKVNRFINVNTKGIEPELIQGGNAVKMPVEVSLFDEVGTIDYSYVENNPITEFYFDGSSPQLAYDDILAKKMAKKIEALTKLVEDELSKMEALYQKAIESADTWYKQQKYKEALAKYEEASLLKPQEKYPQDKIKELDALLKTQQNADLAAQKIEADYKAKIATADALRDQKKYPEAIAAYNEAIKIKATEPYPKDQIANVNKLMEAEKSALAAEANYKKIVEDAGKLFDAKNYEGAKTKYNEALKIKPTDEVVKKRLVEIENKLKELELAAQKDKQYNDIIAKADELFNANKLSEAKAKYNEAIGVNNTKPYPKEKIKEIDLKLAKETADKEKTDKYNAAMKVADGFLAANKLTDAKTKYQEAAAIDPSQSLPKEKIDQIDKQLKAQEDAKVAKEKADKITALLKEGSTLLSKNDLENAKTKYQAVLALDGANSEATAKLTEINAKIAANQSQAQKDEQFKKLKNQGTDLMAKQDWNGAKIAFNEAKAIKEDPEITAKLKEIESKMAADAAFYKLLDEAKALEATNIDGAIAKYKEASAKKPSDEPVKAKIIELEKIKANKADQAKVDKQYNDLMKKGDDAFAAKKYTDAIKLYNDALAVKPDQKDPVDKAAKAKLEAEKVTGSAEQEAYQKILEVGQKSIDEKNWVKAKEMYNRAIKLKPDDVTPKNKLKEIDALIKAEEDAKLNTAEKETAYKNKLTEAEQAAGKNEYDKAITLFSQAQTIKPEEKLPAKRIQEINELKAKAQGNEQSEKMYKEYMLNGNTAQTAKNYPQALSEYKNALTVKNNDKFALAKINEVQKLIEAETNSMSEAKTKEEFDRLVKEGDVLFGQEKWLEAKKTYESALSLIPTDYPTKKKVDKCITNAKKIDEGAAQYQRLIDKADENFNSAKYDKAIELFERALTIKASDPYPKEKLKEIDAILHPVVITPPGPLANLGIPTMEDPAKVQEELEKAELNRKSKKYKKLNEKGENVQNEATSTSEAKTQEILSTTNTLSEIVTSNEKNYEDGDENRQKVVEQVNAYSEGTNQSTSEANTEKYNESLNTNETVQNIQSEISKNYASSEPVYGENGEKLEEYDIKLQKQSIEENTKSYTENIDNQGTLSQIQDKNNAKTVDDFDSRKVVERRVNATQDSIAIDQYQSITKESNSIESLSVKLEEEDKIRVKKTVEDSKISGENDLELKTIENSYVNSQTQDQINSTEKVLNTDEILAKKNEQYSLIPIEQDQNRTNNVETLKTDGKSLDENTRNEYNANLVKHLSNQNEIETKKTQAGAINVQEKVIADKINADLEGIDKKATISYEEKVLSDEEQRLNAKQNMSNIQTEVNNQTTEKAKKVDENISNVKLVSTEIQDQNTKEIENKQDQLKNSQGLLDKINSKEIKYDDKVANELGALYPEGVSQEVFNQTDEDGLLVAVVTRRVVVKNGYGQIYVRTQSLTGLTYSKNGSPSSEYVWQKETQDSKLKKNY